MQPHCHEARLFIDACLRRLRKAAADRVSGALQSLVTLAPMMAVSISLAAAPLPAEAQVSGVGELPSSILQELGLIRLRELCYAKCSAELDDAIDYCNELYPPPSNLTIYRHEWGECVGEALADYYQCTQACPPFAQVIENPFGSGQ
jgi:hypothetical protein